MKLLLECWGSGLGDGVITPLRSGVWQIQSGAGMFILKRRSNRSTVWAEYDLINWLLHHNQPVSPLLYTKKDIPWAEYEGSIYVLYPYVEGVSGESLRIYEHSFAWESGVSLARLHHDLASYPAIEKFSGFDLFQEVASFAWPTVRGYVGLKFRNRLNDLEQGISRNLINLYEVLPRQLIHRDYRPANLVFQEEHLVGILDFDRVRVGIRVYDLCYLATSVLVMVFPELRSREDWFSFVQTLLKGYSSVQSLTNTEAIAYLYLVYLIQIMSIAYHLDSGNTNLADLNVAMLLWINDHHEFLEPLIEKTIVG